MPMHQDIPLAGSTLIIKLGAMGDVLRTTTILNVLEGPVTWVTRPASVPLLENNPRLAEIVPFDAASRIQGRHFDVVACLDDEPEACRLLETVTWRHRIGAYLHDGNVRYGASAAPWYDMGLVSSFGKERADELKRLNHRSYQDFLFAMFGLRFTGEEYVIGVAPRDVHTPRIGIETRADPRWQLKRWGRYPQLCERLRADGFDVFLFEQRQDVRDFVADVNSCRYVVTGDTLTMHVAIALRKPTIAVFGPTSAPEIHDYGRVTKIVSPIDCICCYLRTCDKNPNCMDQIAPADLHAAILRLHG